MKKTLRLRALLFVLFALFLCPTESYATHAMGVDIQYEHLTGNTYQFTVNFYRDCDGVNAPAAVTLDIFSISACAPSTSFTLTQVGAGTEVSPLCAAELPNSSCNGGGQPGVEQYVYQGTYTLPAICNDWVISWDHCCRNATIDNLQAPDTYSMYVETTLDNTNNYDNSSPIFTQLPVPYICDAQQFCYNHGAVDPDLDSLRFYLTDALSTGGAPIPYVFPPYSATYPIDVIGGSVTLDPATGSMCITPNGSQRVVITILVEEWRNQTLIGTTMRDLQVVVQNCSNLQPTMSSGGITNLTGSAVQLDSNSIELCPNQSFSYDVTFSDPNPADNITVTDNLGTAIPGASTFVFGSNPATFNISWTPTINDIGTHSFILNIQDDGCPILGSQVFQFDIDVLDATNAGPDLIYCAGGGPVQLGVTGGSNFTWSVISGDGGSLSCTNCPNPLASPNQLTTYEVLSDLPATCKNRDTINVDSVASFTLTHSPLRDTICKNGAATFTTSATPGGMGPFAYSWTPVATVANATTTTPTMSPQTTTTYTGTVTAANGCVMSDTVRVEVIGAAPVVNAGPDITVCPGSTTPLFASVNPECGTTADPCTGPITTITAGIGGNQFTFYSPFYKDATFGYSNRKQYLVTRAELNALGWTTGGRIDSIGLELGAPGSAMNGMTIKLGCTTLPQLGTNFVPGLAVVKNPFTATPVLGTNMYDLDNPWTWDGVSNIIVEFCTDVATPGTATQIVYDLTPGFNMTTWDNKFNAGGGCAEASGSVAQLRPVIHISHCPSINPATTYLWTPATGLDNPTIQNPNTTPTQTTLYQIDVDGGNGCIATDFLLVSIDSSVYVNGTASNHFPCTGDTVQLDAIMTGSPVPPPLLCGGSTACATSNHIEAIGSGGNAGALPGPFYGTGNSNRWASKVQHIFTATELQQNGMPFSATISQLSWDVQTLFASDWTDVEISIGCTAQDAYSSGNFITTGLTVVYTNAAYTTTNSWNTFNITPYDWDGSSNLVIQFCARTNGPNQDAENVFYTSTLSQGVARSIYRHDNCNNNCVCGQSGGATVSFDRPNMLFTVCDAPPGTFVYSWSPATDLTATNIANPEAEDITSLPIVYTVTVNGGVCAVSDTVQLMDCNLPVEDINFTGYAQNDHIVLEWQTVNEMDINYFEVLHSADGNQYYPIGSHDSHGSNAKLNHYTLPHANPVAGVNWYVLRYYDHSGNVEVSDPIRVSLTEQDRLLSLFPNPTNGNEITIEYYSQYAQVMYVTIADMMGRQISTEKRQLTGGKNSLHFNLDRLPEGSYFFRVNAGSETNVVKVIVTN